MEDLYRNISDLSLNEYPDTVEDAQIHRTPSGTPAKLRIHIVDGSYLDVWLSRSGKYSYHWERRHLQGQMHRHTTHPTPSGATLRPSQNTTIKDQMTGCRKATYLTSRRRR